MRLAIDWPQSFIANHAWLDLAIFLVLGLIQALVWGSGFSTDAAVRASVATIMTSAVSAGITAVGIVLPLSLVSAQIVEPGPGPLEQVFIADVWFTLSLLFGLYTAFSIAVRSSGENVLNRRDIGVAFGLQLFALAIGMIRLLLAIGAVLGGE